jgi:hypothetical protein
MAKKILPQILPYNWHPSAHPKGFATYTNDWAKLIALVFVGIYHFQSSIYQGSIKTHCLNFIGALAALYVLIQYLV